ncbi:predicted protein [Plenodomus lingam JN3]|uniref:Predicted protein n=1 Tax=Leptosphaeria maculans (strain JN3 / isolate v23.1.3 / race Av1-4-5-6-7-8) TaxID=985895 RepID=E4ZT79_LEPMJ|nr:predicted protein [Plenodomus lingam JN3]CBX90021.1 predicted protein [Plenodomus lingam JN3]
MSPPETLSPLCVSARLRVRRVCLHSQLLPHLSPSAIDLEDWHSLCAGGGRGPLLLSAAFCMHA